MLQEASVVFDPAQFCPPWAGAGFVHFLVSGWVPPPHVTEHDPSKVQPDH